ncbi:MAG: alpha-galactosidase, partial [Lachnospiraceae bacterium]|nr:alpha-galactosidase [Lachnospiraceae bacterium]
RKLDSHTLNYLMYMGQDPTDTKPMERDRLGFMSNFPKEYPTAGLGDFKEDALSIRRKNGTFAVGLNYKSHSIYKGKKALKGLPHAFGTEENVTTLELLCEDAPTGLEITLNYSVFEDTDVIVRSTMIRNAGKESLYLTKALSAAMDFDNDDYDVLTLYGDWSKEAQISRCPLTYGIHGVESVNGKSGVTYQPFIALLQHNADYDKGEVFGMHFIYSGNFLANVTMTHYEKVRMVMGISPYNFNWLLEPGEEFQTPEAVLVHSEEGLGGMSRSLHDFYREHLIRSKYVHKKRPILINNWEATYFDFNTEKLVSIAEEAAKSGIEMLVMDDGWFGLRNDDSGGLGDWFVNEDKLPGGLKPLVDRVNALGLKFGIWFEPEMICPVSKLYEQHPDWAIALPDRVPACSRSQYVLDLTREDVADAVYKMVYDVLKSANIEYVKWDMNRQLCDIGSAKLAPERMGEFHHRYMLAVYRMQERLLSDFPDLLLENCSSGGARFDPGMLYYSPQIWGSDDTDAIERLSIQQGLGLLYPLSSIGAHVSDCPNHGTGRTTPFETRGIVAMSGTFGYELDVTRIPESDRAQIAGQVKRYHEVNHIVRDGDYYRLAQYSENNRWDAYMSVTKDKTEALVTYVRVINRMCEKPVRVRLKGLDPEKTYTVEGEERTYTGEELLYGGLVFDTPYAMGDFKAKMVHIKEK